MHWYVSAVDEANEMADRVGRLHFHKYTKVWCFCPLVDTAVASFVFVSWSGQNSVAVCYS